MILPIHELDVEQFLPDLESDRVSAFVFIPAILSMVPLFDGMGLVTLEASCAGSGKHCEGDRSR